MSRLRFDRQDRIEGFDQKLIGRGVVLVAGRNYTGAFVAWSLSSLGVGEVLLAGQSRPETQALVEWLTARPGPLPDVRIHEYPFDIESAKELRWAMAGDVDIVVSCVESAPQASLLESAAREQGSAFFVGSIADGGWCGAGRPPRFTPGPYQSDNERAITALAVAAQIADCVREALNPLGDVPPDGFLGMEIPTPTRPISGRAVVVGIGAIGTYASLLLALLGHDLVLVDFDRVETTNLNRQGLFSVEDATRRARKTTAAKNAIKRLVPWARITTKSVRVDRGFAAYLRGKRAGLLVSSVDNAATRLVLQEIGQELHIPVIQASTGVFAADCVTQEKDGMAIDAQLSGAVSRAARREAPGRPRDQRRGGCAADPSYVVPGMSAAAMAARRVVQVAELYRGLTIHRWRSGSLPKEASRASRQQATVKAAARFPVTWAEPRSTGPVEGPPSSAGMFLGSNGGDMPPPEPDASTTGNAEADHVEADDELLRLADMLLNPDWCVLQGLPPDEPGTYGVGETTSRTPVVASDGGGTRSRTVGRGPQE